MRNFLMILLLTSTNVVSTDKEWEERRLNAVEYNYECTVKGTGGPPSLISETYYIKWYPNRFGVMMNIEKNDNLTKPSFIYKPDASVSFQTFQNGLITLPLYVFGGTHGGGEFLRGFFITDEMNPDMHTILIDTADGTFTLTKTYLQTSFATGVCVSLGLGKAFPEQAD